MTKAIDYAQLRVCFQKEHHGILTPIRAIVCDTSFPTAQYRFNTVKMLAHLAGCLLFSNPFELKDPKKEDLYLETLADAKRIIKQHETVIGYFAAGVVDGHVRTGWSLCNVDVDFDKFSRKQAIDMAIRRALFSDNYPVEQFICSPTPYVKFGRYRDTIFGTELPQQVLNFINRCLRYYFHKTERNYFEDSKTKETNVWQYIKNEPVVPYPND